MYKLKEFLIRLCQVEQLNVKELQKLTGKSQSVVYSWLDGANTSNFPCNESLAKILCRLGITLDDFLKCKSDKVIDYSKYRVYKDYLYGSSDDLKFSGSILEDVNHENICNCYVDDLIEFKLMIDNFLNNKKVDLERFDMLSKHINPYFVSTIDCLFDDYGGGVCYPLKSCFLEDFKMRMEYYEEFIEGDSEYEKGEIHKLYYPFADFFVLYVARNNINVLRKFMKILDKEEKNRLMHSYLIGCYHEKNYDKNNKLFKYLVKNDCKLVDFDREELVEIYNKNIEKITIKE